MVDVLIYVHLSYVDSSICSLIEFDLNITLHEYMHMHILSNLTHS